MPRLDFTLQYLLYLSQLYNIAKKGRYIMHTGQFATLAAVFQYTQRRAWSSRHTKLEPLPLTAAEMAQREASLRALSEPLNVPTALLQPPR